MTPWSTRCGRPSTRGGRLRTRVEPGLTGRSGSGPEVIRLEHRGPSGLRMEMVGLRSAFAAAARPGATGRQIDSASYLTRVTHPDGTKTVIIGDLRGVDLDVFRASMERERPGSWTEFFAGASPDQRLLPPRRTAGGGGHPRDHVAARGDPAGDRQARAHRGDQPRSARPRARRHPRAPRPARRDGHDRGGAHTGRGTVGRGGDRTDHYCAGAGCPHAERSALAADRRASADGAAGRGEPHAERLASRRGGGGPEGPARQPARGDRDEPGDPAHVPEERCRGGGGRAYRRHPRRRRRWPRLRPRRRHRGCGVRRRPQRDPGNDARGDLDHAAGVPAPGVPPVASHLGRPAPRRHPPGGDAG